MRVRPTSARNDCHTSPTVGNMVGTYGAQRGFVAADVEAALTIVPGVAQAFVGPNDGSLTSSSAADVVRLVLDADADESFVASSVNRILRMQFGLVLDGASIQVSTTSVPTPTDLVPRLSVVESADEADDDDVDYRATVVQLEGDIASFLGKLGAASDGSGDFHDDVLTSAARHPSGGRVFIPTDNPVPAGESRVDATSRMSIAHLTIAAEGKGMRASVCLSHGGIDFVGSAVGSSTSAAVNRSVAQATLGAISEAINHRELLDLEAVVITNVNDQRVAVVQVVRNPVGGSERLTGASEVRDDVRQAVIRATLDSVNRRLSEQLSV